MANTRFKSHYGINATANSYIEGDLQVTGNLSVGGSLVSTGTSVGDFIPDADQRNLGNTTNRWNLLGFTANLASTLTVTGAASLSNTIQVTGQATLQNNLIVSGSANVGTTLNVTGAANLASSISVSGNGTVLGIFTANANSSFTNNLVTFTGNSTANVVTIGAANVTVDSGVLFIDSVNNRLGINNTAPGVALRVTGDVDISATANVQGATNLRSTLAVTGNSTLSGTLQTINGNSNFDSGVLFVDAVNNRVGINNTTPSVALRVTGDADISATANVQGATTLRGTLTVNGAATVANTLAVGNTSVTGFINVSSTANVGGATTLRNTLTVNGAVTVANVIAAGNTSITGFINVSSTANVGGAATIGGTITATGNSSITNGLISATSNATANVITFGGGNANFDSGVLFVDAVNNRVGINNTAPGVALRVTGDADISATANVQGATTLRGTLTVNGAATLVGGVTISSNPLTANGGTGSAGQVLTSNGSVGSPYWSSVTSGTVTSVSSGNGLTGGPITGSGTLSVVANNGLVANTTGVFVIANNGIVSNSTGVFVNANTGIVSNSSGVFANATYIQGLTVNNANNTSFLGGVAAANYVQNTDSRTLSGNLVFSAANVAFTNNIRINGTLTANGGVGTGGQVLSSNGSTGSPYWRTITSGTVTSVSSGNGLTGGPITGSGTLSVVANNGLIANATGVYVNANNGLVSNSTGVFVIANSGIVSNSTGVFVNANTGIVSNSTGVFANATYIQGLTVNNANNTSFLGGVAAANYVQNTDSRTLSGNLAFSAANVAFTNNIRIDGTMTANGSTGTSGQVLTSNGSTGSPYWSNTSDKVKAWAKTRVVTTGVVTVDESFNLTSFTVSSVSGTPNYWRFTANLINPVTDSNYAVFATAHVAGPAGQRTVIPISISVGNTSQFTYSHGQSTATIASVQIIR